MQFSWDEYLQETGSEVAPNSLFEHVQKSQNSTITRGQEMEVEYSSGKWWRVSVLVMSSQLVNVKFVQPQNSLDLSEKCFWIDLVNPAMNIKSLGWCRKNSITFCPPSFFPSDSVLPNYTEETELKLSVMQSVIESKCQFSVCNLIRIGGYLECEHELDPLTVWLVKIINNSEGRLRIVWFGGDSSKGPVDFHLFYLNRRLHPLGWAKSRGYKYKPPSTLLMDRELSNIDTFLKGAPPALSAEYFNEMNIPVHSFEVGWKLETVNPLKPHLLQPATIIEIINEYYFIVELDDLREPSERQSILFLAHAACPKIMPANASYVRGIYLTPPPGYLDLPFTWNRYLETFSTYAPYESYFRCNKYEDIDNDNDDNEFMLGFKLEVVDPENPSAIVPGTVTRTYGQLIWIHLEHKPNSEPNIMVDAKSTDIYPVGWSSIANYSFEPPLSYQEFSDNSNSLDNCCPRIYFNHRCYSGTACLSKSGLESLPRYVGPGTVVDTFREILCRLASISYKPFRFLRDIEVEDSNCHDLMQLTILEVKIQKRLVTTLIELPKYRRSVEEFCRQIGLLLEACPHLISLQGVSKDCPENCSVRIKNRFLEKLPSWKRRYVITRPLTLLGISYKSLKSAASRDSDKGDKGGTDDESDSSSSSSDSKAPEPPTKMQTRGVRLASYVLLEKRKRHLPKEKEENNQQTAKVEINAVLNDCDTLSKSDSKIARYSSNNVSRQDFKSQPELCNNPLSFDPVILAGEIQPIKLESNPLHWNSSELADYLKNTDCSDLVVHFLEEGVDGQAFMLLTLPMALYLMRLKLDIAVKLCRHVVRLKRAFLEQFCKNEI